MIFSADTRRTDLFQYASDDPAALLQALGSCREGLTNAEARARTAVYGKNEVVPAQSRHGARKFFATLADPSSVLLVALSIVSYLTHDGKSVVLIMTMLLLSVILRLVQESRADMAVAKLKAMIHTTATVMRGGSAVELPLAALVPGDIVHLSAGDMIPADIRILESKDLFVNQATLTGESLPAEKHATMAVPLPASEFDLPTICFMGTNVVSGIATAVVCATGRATHFGVLALKVEELSNLTSFDRGIRSFTWLMIRFIAVMVPAVFFINWFGKGDWFQALLFAVAVAVGLTPELLPMIVTVNLSKGALALSRRNIIVKRLNAIQTFGAMDVLCTDKTGTLTEGKVTLIKHVDIAGHESAQVLDYAYVNSFFQTGLKNLLDVAVLQHGAPRGMQIVQQYTKIDEIPFDFVRRRMSVIVSSSDGAHIFICKGAIEEIMRACTMVATAHGDVPLATLHMTQKGSLVETLSREGFRVVALASKNIPQPQKAYAPKDEAGMTLLGFLAFLDPPKKTVAESLRQLARHGLEVKILTGDNELVTRTVCREVGLRVDRIVTGAEIETMTDAALAEVVEQAQVFDKMEPHHKQRVVQALQRQGHTVGFMGDGINDAPALKAADIGISVDTAADIAKESSDIILTEKSLLVLQDGVREGRTIFANIVKYINMTASSNFGNMFSVVGASMFLPFLPMLPLQIITTNLLYDFSQITIPTDGVDEDYIMKPRQWRIDHVRRFIFTMGPVSSLFDYATYALMLIVFHAGNNPALFQTGWFVESLMSQTLIIHIIRTRKIPFMQSRASWPLLATSVAIVMVGSMLPFSPFAGAFGFVPLPARYWAYLAGIMAGYFTCAQAVKHWFTKRYGWY